MKVNADLRIVKRGPRSYEVIWLTHGYVMATRLFSSAAEAYEFVDWMRKEEKWITENLKDVG